MGRKEEKIVARGEFERRGQKERSGKERYNVTKREGNEIINAACRFDF